MELEERKLTTAQRIWGRSGIINYKKGYIDGYEKGKADGMAALGLIAGVVAVVSAGVGAAVEHFRNKRDEKRKSDNARKYF